MCGLHVLWDLLGSHDEPLNEKTFVRFRVVFREQISPTNFVLTVEPWSAPRPCDGPNLLVRAWRHGTFSVQVKQPQIQVAREYTPLPPAPGDELDDLEHRRIRLLVRQLEGGEVSSYLGTLRVGDRIELRGPCLGPDVYTRLGQIDPGAATTGPAVGRHDGQTDGHDKAGARAPHHVVFVAGGTGIAPALQVARAVLDGNPATRAPTTSWQKIFEGFLALLSGWEQNTPQPAPPTADPWQPRVAIIWANRQRADCLGCETLQALTSASASTSSPGSATGGPIMQRLADLKRRHGARFSVACTVDEEGTFVNAATIQAAAVWAAQYDPQQPPPPPGPVFLDDDGPTCPYHAQAATTRSTGQDPLRAAAWASLKRDGWVRDWEADERAPRCGCADDGARGGRNLLVVSGPEGFVARLAGPKVWTQGRQVQGEVEGVVGELMARKPGFWADWLVLKL